MNKRYYGAIGILGSILLFVGDMFLFGHFGNAIEFDHNIEIVAQHASQTRLFIGGILGPLGAMLSVFGFWHIHLNTKKSSPLISLIIFISLTCMMFFGGSYHTIWTVRMLLFKYPLSAVDNATLFISSFNTFLTTIFIITVAVGYVGGLLLAILILLRKSIYPRWTVLITPGILLLFAPLVKHISSPIGSVVFGGYLNLVFFIFLTCSVIFTWNEKNIGLEPIQVQ